MKTIAIRADANETIAMGHLMRCMSIAFQLKKAGHTVIFILAENYAENLILQNNFPCICMSRIYKHKDQELEELTAILTRHKAACILVDSYDLTSAYIEHLNKICKTAYIDDLQHFEYPAHLTVYYRYGAEQMQEALDSSKAPQHAKRYLLGIRYAPLREVFAAAAPPAREQIEQILITTGGTDPYEMLVGILETMQQAFPAVKKHVVAGKFYHNLPLLHKIAAADDTVLIYHDIPDIDRVMRQCDAAVSAGGGTLAELCACGVPTVCFTLADNQLDGTKAYADACLVLYAGDVRNSRDAVLQTITAKMELLQDDPAYRKCMGKRAKEAVDGRGASRIAEEIIQLIQET